MGDSETRPELGAGDANDEPDETLKERLWGLTEMIPVETVENVVAGAETATKIISRVYKFLRTTTWIIVTSTLICLGPIYIEFMRLEYNRLRHGALGPCIGGKLRRQGGGHPCQPFRPQPQQPSPPPPPQ